MPLTLNLLSFALPDGSNLVTRVSTAADGTEGQGAAIRPQFSADGRYVVFESNSESLVAGDTNGWWDVFRRDLVTGDILRVSTDANNTQVTLGGSRAHISADGRYVVFQSGADNLVAGDANGVIDVFRKDLKTGAIVGGSTHATGALAGNFESTDPKLSADGRYVVFESGASNLVAGDANNVTDIFRKDLVTGAIVRVSTDTTGAEAAGGASYGANISADGRYVTFESGASNLVPNDTNGKFDIFRKDLVTGEIMRVNTDATGAGAMGGGSYGANISADGHYVVFASDATNLVEGDANGQRDVFRKNLVTGEIIRVNTGSTGAEATGGHSLDPRISADGRYVVFESEATNLVADDKNGMRDIFRKDLVTGEIMRLSVADAGMQGSQEADAKSTRSSLSPDGRFAVFESVATNLVVGDNNAAWDVFLVDANSLTHRQAMLDGRFVDLRFGVGAASSATLDWGDGSPADTATPVLGAATFRHAFASQGSKAVTVTVTEGALSWAVPYIVTVQPGGANPIRNTALADTVTGGAGADRLEGDLYGNVLIGKGGGDTYIVNNAGDRVIETSGGGTDTVIASVNHILSGNVENLVGQGTGAIALTGNSLANRLTGNTASNKLSGGAGNDILSGGFGNDKLMGGLGKDVLAGGAGKDIFVFDSKPNAKTNLDKIVDFNVRDDSIWLDNKYMAKLGKGTPLKPLKLNAKFFTIGDKAKDANDYLIYNAKKGILFYDADGAGTKAAAAIATLKKGLKLTYADFFVI